MPDQFNRTWVKSGSLRPHFTSPEQNLQVCRDHGDSQSCWATAHRTQQDQLADLNLSWGSRGNLLSQDEEINFGEVSILCA